jgi:hypothetical protein
MLTDPDALNTVLNTLFLTVLAGYVVTVENNGSKPYDHNLLIV